MGIECWSSRERNASGEVAGVSAGAVGGSLSVLAS
jgi:hypothetical protein